MMKSKFFSKTVKKTALWSVLIAIVLAAAIVVCALFGFNKSLALDDNKTVTVSVNRFAYEQDGDRMETECKSLLKIIGVEYEYTIEGTMGGDACELVLVFDNGVDVEKCADKLQSYFDIQTNGGVWDGCEIQVSASNDVAVSVLAEHFVLRACIAGGVLAIVVLAYVAIRYKRFSIGLTAGVSTLLGMLLTAGVLILTRIPATENTATIIAVSGLLTAAAVALTYGKISAAKAENSEASNEETVANAIPVKEIVCFGGILIFAMLIVGILGKSSAAWVATSAIVAVIASAFVALFFAPAAYLSVKNAADQKPVKDAYVGAKKTSNKQKKVKAALEELPVETSKKEEKAVEETPTQEEEPATVEETVEASAEESEEETPAVEEAASVEEEAAEEKTEE